MASMSDRPVSRLVGGSEPLDRGARLSRRDLLRSAALAAGGSALLAACGGGSGSRAPSSTAPSGSSGGSSGQGQPNSLQALAANLPQLSLLNAQSDLPVGRNRFTFGLSTSDNRLVQGGTPKLWFATDQTSKPLGPFEARFLQMDAYDKLKDRSPRSELTGFYVADVDLPTAGNWLTVAVLDAGGQRAAGQGAIPVKDKVVAQVGTKATSGKTPVATSPADVAKICTREPPCSMHYISLDKALASGKPTAISFATPLLCESRMCGPVVDEETLAFQKIGKEKANFIHLEIYPQRDINKPAPLFLKWGFQSEPWLIVIDRNGTIRGRLGEGPVVASEIEAAVTPLLS
jgi:hypothetical protein